MSTVRTPATYTTYILRCWQEGANWRYSLEEIGSGKRQGFAGLDDFVAFLLARTGQPDLSDKSADEVNLPRAK